MVFLRATKGLLSVARALRSLVTREAIAVAKGLLSNLGSNSGHEVGVLLAFSQTHDRGAGVAALAQMLLKKKK